MTVIAVITPLYVYAVEYTETAYPSDMPVYINGVSADIKAYNINGNNYFMLRDIAAAFDGTQKQFDVE